MKIEQRGKIRMSIFARLYNEPMKEISNRPTATSTTVEAFILIYINKQIF